MEKIKEEMETYRIKVLKFQKKKGIINFLLFLYYKKKYTELALIFLDEVELKYHNYFIL